MNVLIKNYSKLVITLIAIFTLSGVLLSTNVSADYWFGGRAYSAKPTAWYDQSVSMYGYTSNFDAGRAYWNSHSAVEITRNYSSYIPNQDKYCIGNTSTSGLLGRITPVVIKNGTAYEANPSDYWNYVIVTMYDNQMRAQSSYSSAYINMNAAHEIGHSIKMAHTDKVYYSVMPQGWRPIPSSLTNYDSGQVSSKW